MRKSFSQLFSSKLSLIGLFVSLVLLLAIPMMVLFAREQQTIRGKAAELSPTPISLSSGTGIIAGYVYHDDNKDGEREQKEQPFPDVSIQVKELKGDGLIDDPSKIVNVVSDITTDTSGYFRFRYALTPGEETSYSVKVILPDNYKTITSNPIIIANPRQTPEKIVEFGLFPLKPLPSIVPTTLPTLPAKRSFIRTTTVTPFPSLQGN